MSVPADLDRPKNTPGSADDDGFDGLVVVLGKTIEQLKGHVKEGTKGLTLIKVCNPAPFLCSSNTFRFHMLEVLGRTRG